MNLKSDSLRKLAYHLRHTELSALTSILRRKLITPYTSFPVPNSGEKFCLMISGCPGDSFRYRCEHQAAQLRALGQSADICYSNQLTDVGVVDRYQWLWLHRVPYDARIERLFAALRRTGKPVAFDTDDLVFDEKMVSHMRSIEWMSAREVDQVRAAAKGYYQTLSRCDFATVSTDYLRDAVLRLFPQMNCLITPNMLSGAQIASAEQALQAARRDNHRKKDTVTIGYFSGTRTHDADFRECSAALVRLMEACSAVRLMLVGYLDVGPEFARFGRRVARHRFVPWQRLSRLMTRVDINLAPLELDNPFTRCKSDLKYIEAAIMGVPTVASAVGSFAKTIEHGENGYLCRTEEDWFVSLTRLVEDTAQRKRMGSLAKQLVLESRTIAQGAEQLDKTLLEVVKGYLRSAGASALPGNEPDFTAVDL